jgi:hypothetical protein
MRRFPRICGRNEVVVNTLDGAAWHRRQRHEGGWSVWHSFDDPPVKNTVSYFPTLVYNGDGRLELFTRALDGTVRHRWQQRPSAGWSAWSSLEHPPEHRMVDGGPVVARFQFLDGGWSGWRPLAKPPQVGFAAVGAHADGRLLLFASEEDRGSLWKLEQDITGSWTVWFMIQDTMDLYRLQQTTPNGTEWSGERFFNQDPV